MATTTAHRDHHAAVPGVNGEKHNGHGPATNGNLDPNGADMNRTLSQMTSGYAAPHGGYLMPGHWKPYEHRKFANPAPLGLCGFALTTFVLSLVNLQARDVAEPNIVVPLAFGYGGLVQLLAGMWEMAVGNTFGATALSSYGGFWIAYAILLTPEWNITGADGPYMGEVNSPLGFFLTGWFIFTTLLLLCTLKSTVAFFSLFFTLDLAFLMLAMESYAADNGALGASANLRTAGGVFGILAAFLAWYCALAGLQDESNSFFQVPVIHFPWSDTGKERRKQKSQRAMD